MATQISKALLKLRDTYNFLYLEKKPNTMPLIEQTEKIFECLDVDGHLHLRLSSVFFLTAAIIILERYTFPLSYESFKIHMDDLRRELCEVGGIVTLRGFKNFILNLSSTKRMNYL
jgi:hypothetical protein